MSWILQIIMGDHGDIWGLNFNNGDRMACIANLI